MTDINIPFIIAISLFLAFMVLAVLYDVVYGYIERWKFKNRFKTGIGKCPFCQAWLSSPTVLIDRARTHRSPNTTPVPILTSGRGISCGFWKNSAGLRPAGDSAGSHLFSLLGMTN